MGDVQDDAFDCLAIRANLDAFWSHASKTVSSHRTEDRFLCKYSKALEITHPFPRLGPFPLGHRLGMLQAIMLELRALEPGRKGKTVTWDTTRHQRATYTVLWETSPDIGGDITLSFSSKRGRFVATCNPTEGRWFQRLITGTNAHIGNVVSQDKAYTIKVLLKLVSMFEAEWSDLGLDIPLESICACIFLLLTCLGGMRGYEAVWTDLAALRYDVDYWESMDDYSAVSWPIVERFKAHHGVAG